MSEVYAERTIAAYRVHAKKAAQNWARNWRPSRFLRSFARMLPPDGRMLDYGCGIGTDLAWLRRQGFCVEGIEGALEFVQQARKRCPGVQIRHARFRTARLPGNHYDGIWCNAALMHVPPEEFSFQLRKLKEALRPNGVLAMTLAWGSKKGFVRQDWIPGRYIAGYRKREAAVFFRGWKVRSLRVVKKDGRQGRWIQIMASPIFPGLSS